MRRYFYIGPAELAKGAADSPAPRACVTSPTDVAAWLAAQRPARERDGTLVVTFVVLSDGLWIADRRSEHVVCARGLPVLSAGELTSEIEPQSAPASPRIVVVEASNQSTGYCPEPCSWNAVATALDAAGIPHPGAFTRGVTFRRCLGCHAMNLVKDDWYVCELCGHDLPRERGDE